MKSNIKISFSFFLLFFFFFLWGGEEGVKDIFLLTPQICSKWKILKTEDDIVANIDDIDDIVAALLLLCVTFLVVGKVCEQMVQTTRLSPLRRCWNQKLVKVAISFEIDLISRLITDQSTNKTKWPGNGPLDRTKLRSCRDTGERQRINWLVIDV